jgi:hypothetical protein
MSSGGGIILSWEEAKDKKVKSSDDKYGCGLSHPRARRMFVLSESFSG